MNLPGRQIVMMFFQPACFLKPQLVLVEASSALHFLICGDFV